MKRLPDLTGPNLPAIGHANAMSPDFDPRRPAAGVSLFDVCWRRRFGVLFVLALSVAAGIAYLQVAPKIYTSAAKLLVQQNGPRLLTAADDASGRSDGYLYQQLEIIRSRSIIDEAVDGHLLDAMAVFPASSNRTLDLQNKISVGIGKRDEVIGVQLDSAQPEAAARLVNAIVAAYQSYQAHSVQSSAQAALDILRHEKEKQDVELAEKLRQLVEFKQAHADLFFTDEHGTNVLMRGLSTIADQATRARMIAGMTRASIVGSTNRMKAESDARIAEAQASALEQQYRTERERASEVNATQAEYQKLQAEVDRTTKGADALDSRIKELDVTSYGGAMNIRVLESARADERPSWPRKSTVLGTAVALGLALGCGLAVTREWLDRGIRSAAQATRLLGLPVLANVPLLARNGVVEVGRAMLSRGTDDEFVDAYQSLAATLRFVGPAEAGKSVFVTSPDAGDGKSACASNLAVAAAASGRRTLLIDADVRRPTLHALFNTANLAGLADVVGRGVRIEQAIAPTGVPNLSVMGTGSRFANPAEVAGSQAFGAMLERLDASFDLIVIDGPATLVAPEARIFAAQADLTLLVLRAGHSTQPAARAACERLRAVGADLVGALLNGVAPRRRAGRRAPTPADDPRPAWATTPTTTETDDDAVGFDRPQQIDAGGRRLGRRAMT